MAAEPEKPQNGSTSAYDDDDEPVLSSHALAALKEFLEEQQQQNHPSPPVVDQTAESEGGETAGGGKVALVAEDWRLSQFWYDPLTAETVAKEVISLLSQNKNSNSNSNSTNRAACISCPTLYAYIKNIEPNACTQLLEYDNRFEQYGAEFTFYDYNQPQDLPAELKHAFQVVVADPPYLVSQLFLCLPFVYAFQECFSVWEVQKDRAAELMGLRACGFRPQHSNKLGNEFRLFTDYDPGERLGGWELD
ncbi:hypothetical protein Tsubulata_030907 [Turnera subulata]|uniref:Protein-lysine N-methyltransferase Tsubulata_030907 n=1 Tax=Turnera subulata TaxID=218843 RepID=A0A9Q0F5M0_9ROSI|nr:hypothetical protein Tsubulata_030907 [Turnera subulata]